ncbi:MAG TPA: HAMP domain-containing sensor histidine kinase [Candidatus Binatia bacterium]|nr:HAMP domain-containing sensor histidine kinase [Candidatus Binatia bacterium]
MRASFRAIARAGRDSDVWPVALLIMAVLVPALCLLWFMNAAMRNEHLAAQQKLVDSYRGHLGSAQSRLEAHWQNLTRELDELANTTPVALAFAKAVEAGLVDSLVLFDGAGHLAYPNTPSAPALESNDSNPLWAKAGWLEYQQKNFSGAAYLYEKLFSQATNTSTAARALQAQARCLVCAGQTNAAVRLVKNTFSDERYREVADAQGRLIAANVELMAFELSGDEALAERLRQRLTDYQNPVLAAPQRRFLMKEVQRLSPGTEFPTLSAEELAAPVSQLPGDSSFDRTPGMDAWRFTTPNRRVVALFETDKLANRLESLLGQSIKLVPPGNQHSAALVAISAGRTMPGWQLALTGNGWPKSPIHLYFWIAMPVLSAMGVLALLAARVMRQRVALARLKNDLAATVSHELKTPLSSMRVLVDTLLDAQKPNEQTTREYLELIARENDRLNRLIHNFLAFSRIERNKDVVELRRIPVAPIIKSAAEALPGCKVDIHIQSYLPDINADPDAIGTALINLLENACKYSDNSHLITLRAHANNGTVVLSVQDRGVGIPPGDLKKIFKPFYQVDRALSRKAGGCGLGLAIVQSIVKAHHGQVLVESQPGRGSTFSISLPAAKHS